MAGAVTASRFSQLFNDSNADGKVSPDDTLITHILLANGTVANITSVTIADSQTAHTTYVAGTTVVTMGDIYSLTGNTPITYSAGQGLLANDYHADGTSPGTNAGLVVASVNGTALGGAITVHDAANNALTAGSVTVGTDGSFTFTPAAGYTGTATFTYTDSDGSGTVGQGIVNLAVNGLVWYVQGGAATNGDGTYANPFNNLASVSSVDHANDTVVLHGTTTGGITLKGGETFYGDGHGSYIVNGHQITNGGTDSLINHSATAITLGSGNTIDGIDLVGTSTTAIGVSDNGSTAGSLSINHMAISGQGRIISIDHGGNVNITLASASSTVATGGAAIDLIQTQGSLTVTGATSITGTGTNPAVNASAAPGAMALDFKGAFTANVDTGANSVTALVNLNPNVTGSSLTFESTADITANGTTGGISVGSLVGTSTFNAINGGLHVTTAGGAALQSFGPPAATVVWNVAGAGNTLTSATGQLISFTDASIGASGLNFASATATGVVALNHAIYFSNTDTAGGNVSIGTVGIAGTAGVLDAIHIDTGSSANFTFGATTIGGASAVGGDAIELNGAGNGNVSFTSVNINNVGGDGVKIVSADHSVTISGGTIGNTNDPTGIDLNINGGTGAVSVAASLTKTTAGHALDINGHATGQIDVTGAISGTGGVDNGISIAGITSGTVNVTGNVTLSTAAANAIVMDNNSGGVINFTGATESVATTSGAGVTVSNSSGGTVNFSTGGAQTLGITTTSGTGINLNADTGGAVNFGGTSQAISTTIGTGINIADGASATGPSASFTTGNLSVSTTTGAAINAVDTNATTPVGLLTISGANNTVTQTGAGGGAATAITINGIGEAVMLKSVSVGSAGQSGNTAIFLQNAGSNAVNNFFKITGTGSTLSDANSGGAINHTTGGADNSHIAGDGIYMNNVGGISLANLKFMGTYDNFGIEGFTVNNFTLKDTDFSTAVKFGTNHGAGLEEGDVRFGNAGADGSGNGLTGTANFLGNTFDKAFSTTVGIYNNFAAGSSNTLNVTFDHTTAHQQTFGAVDSAVGNDAIYLKAGGTGNGGGSGAGFNLTALIQNNDITHARGDLVQLDGESNSKINLTLLNNNFANAQANIVSAGGGVTIGEGGGNYQLTYNVTGNTFKGASGTPLVVAMMGSSGTSSGVILNNTIGTPSGTTNAKSDGTGASDIAAYGIWIHSERDASLAGNQTAAVRIEGNTVADVGKAGLGSIVVTSNNTSPTHVGNNVVEVTLTNNTIEDFGNPTVGGPAAGAGFYGQAGASVGGDNGQIGLNATNNKFWLGGGDTTHGTYGAFVLDSTSTGAKYYLPGYPGAPNDQTAIQSFLMGTKGNTSVEPVNGADVLIGNAPITGTAFTQSVPIQLSAQPGEDWESQLNTKAPTQQVVDTSGETGTGATGGSTGDGGTTGGSTGGTTGATDTTPTPPPPVLATLDQATLDHMVDAAIARWEAAGATVDELAAMRAVSVTLSTIAGIGIGDSTPGHIQIDADAAGFGWFVDATPGEDSEFSGTGSRLTAPDGSVAAGHVDLLTVLEHELGHQIGLEDDYNPADNADIMFGYVNLGERRIVTASDVAHASGTAVGHESFALSPVNVGTVLPAQTVDISYRSLVDHTFTPGAAPTFTGTSTINYTDAGGAHVLSPTESIAYTGDTLKDGAGVTTTASPNLFAASLTLGNLVYNDANKNGTFDAGDTGIGNVSVKLYTDNNSNGVYDAGTDLLVASTTTSNVAGTVGQYSFTGLAPGDYLVVIPAANFGAGPLGALLPHPGALDPDNNVDGDNNGAYVAGGDVASQAITLAYDTEGPSFNAAGVAGNDTNNTVDFGFQPNTPPTGTSTTQSVAEDGRYVFSLADFGGTDSDGTIAGVYITSVPANGKIYLDTDGPGGSLGSASTGNDIYTKAAFDNGWVVFVPNADFNGSTSFTFKVQDNQNAFDPSAKTFGMTVTAANDPVTGTAPASATVNEDSSGNAITGMSISDVDAALAPSGVYSVTLSATHGTLTLTTLAGLGFDTGDGTSDASMSFHGTLAAINTALASAHYTPDGNYAGAAQIQLDVTDTYGGIVATGTGSATTDTDVIAVTVTGINDAPSAQDEAATTNDTTDHVFTAADFTAGFSDPNDNPANNPLNVIITSLPATGTLTYNGTTVTAGQMPYTVSIADISSGLLHYHPAAASGGNDYSFNFKVQDDGGIAGGGQDTSAQQLFTMHVTVSDFPPVVDLDSTAAGSGTSVTFTEQQAVQVAPNATVTDSDSPDFNGGSLTVAYQGGGTASDYFAAYDEGGQFVSNGHIGISGTSVYYNKVVIGTITSQGLGNPFVVTFNASATPAAAEALIRDIRVSNTSDNPPGASRTADFTLTDGDGGSTTVHADVTITPVNDAPVVSAQTSDQHVAEDTAVNFSVANAFTDPEGDSLTYIATRGDGSALPAWLSFNQSTATFTGTPPQDFNGTIPLKVTASDGSLSTPETFNLVIDPVNDNPVLNTTGTSFNYTENDPAHALFASLAVSDVDNANFNGGTLTITDAASDPGDSLAIGSDPNISFTPTDATHGTLAYQGNTFGTLTINSNGYSVALNANATPAAIHALLADLAYVNTSDDPVGGDHAITVTLTDGSGGSANFVTHVNVIPVNDSPSIANLDGDAVTYVENDSIAYLDTGASVAPNTVAVPGPGNALVTDPDSHDFAGATLTVSVSGNKVATEDRILFSFDNANTPGQISVLGSTVYYGSTAIGTLNAGGVGVDRVVTFNANATATMVSAVIHQFGYTNTSDNPSILDRTIAFTLTDGDGGSTVAHTVVHVTPVNDNPVLDLDSTKPGTGTNNGLFEQDPTGAGGMAPNATVSDVDSANFDTGTLTVSITANGQSGDQIDVSSYFSDAGNTHTVTTSGNQILFDGTVVGTYTAGNSATALVVTFNANATPFAAGWVTKAINVTFTNDDPSSAVRTLHYVITDGDGGTASANATYNVTAANDAPQLSAPTSASVSFTENNPAVAILQGVVLTDPDNPANFSTGSIDIAVTGTPGGLNLKAGSNFTIHDNGNSTYTLMGPGNVPIGDITGFGTTHLQITNLTANATPAALNDLVDDFTFSIAGDDVADASGTITLTFNDGHHTGYFGDGALTATQTQGLTVTGLNDAPVNGVPGSTQAATEDGSLTFDAAHSNLISISDADDDGGSLTVTLSVAHGTISLSGTANLSFSTGDGSGDATMTFSGTKADINAALNGLVYTPNGDFNGDDTLSITTNDNGNSGDGPAGQDADTVAIHVSAVNDAPVASGSATAPAINEDSPSATGYSVGSLFTANYSDATDNQSAYGGSSAGAMGGIAVTGNASGAAGQWQYWNGASWTNIGPVSDSSALTISAGTAIRFNPAQDYNSAAPQLTVHLADNTVSISDGAHINLSVAGATGGTTAWSAGAVTLDETINPVNDPPVLDLNGGGAGTSTSIDYTEGQSFLNLAPAATVTDVDSPNYDNGVLTVAFTANGTTDDVLAVIDQGISTHGAISVGEGALYYQFGTNASPDIEEIGTFSGGTNGDPLVITFNALVTPSIAQQVIADIGYENVSNAPSELTRTVAVTLVESDGATSVPATVTINVTAIDNPAVAQDDSVSTDEATILSGTVFGNDFDTDGPPLQVATVNGSAANVGQTIVLASGATVKLNADGTFTYNPNHQFDTLTSPAGGENGASNTSATDHFTYTLVGGNGATVTVDIGGIANGADHLEGSPGDDTIHGTPHNDYFDLTQGGSDSVFGLGGDDGFFFGSAYDKNDKVDGGAGRDEVGLLGDYTGGNAVTVLGGNMVNVEVLDLFTSEGSPVGYDITWKNGNLSDNQLMNIYAGALKSGENVKFDGSAETHGYFIMFGGAGTDTFTGGAKNDGFYFGPDKFSQADHVDGGAGTQNQLGLDGSYTFSAASPLGTLGGNFVNIQTVLLYAGDPNDLTHPYPNAYHIETNDLAVAAGQQLTIYGALTVADLYFNGSAETDGSFKIIAGGGNDTIIGSANGDILFGGLGSDTLTGGGGNDLFVYTDVAQSFGANTDRITDFTVGDKIDLSQIDADTTKAGDQAFTFIGSNSFDGQAGELRAVFDSAHNVWTVEVDTNGDQHADMTIVVATTGGHILAGSDFVL